MGGGINAPEGVVQLLHGTVRSAGRVVSMAAGRRAGLNAHAGGDCLWHGQSVARDRGPSAPQSEVGRRRRPVRASGIRVVWGRAGKMPRLARGRGIRFARLQDHLTPADTSRGGRRLVVPGSRWDLRRRVEENTAVALIAAARVAGGSRHGNNVSSFRLTWRGSLSPEFRSMVKRDFLAVSVVRRYPKRIWILKMLPGFMNEEGRNGRRLK